MNGFASCCVLSYERPRLLRTAVKTLMEKAGAPLELIVHDDGSEDEDLHELLDGWRRDGVASTMIVNPPGHNQGVGEAIRRCFAVAQGDLLIKIDQDLVFEPDWLAKVNRIFEHNAGYLPQKKIGAMGAFRYAVDPVDHKKMHRRWHHPGADGEWEEVEDFVGSFIAVPRAVYERYGPIETHSDAFAEDVMFKRALQADGWALALPADDIAANHGFGIGPSTVNLEEGGVRTIHHETVIHGL